MKYRCLIVDHDDTVVDSTATVHYPCFVEYCRQFIPDYHCTLEEYLIQNFDPGVVGFFRNVVGMSDQQMRHEQEFWNAYVQNHIPKAFPGMRDLLWRFKDKGGILCVISQSYRHNILRDYRANGLPVPDLVYGWELPPELRKPNPWSLKKALEEFDLSPDQALMVDDLKPGFDMAKACGVSFAAAGWSNDIPRIQDFMRQNCDLYFKTIGELSVHLLSA